MNDPNHVIAVEFDDERVALRMADGRVISNPLAWHPWLLNASAVERATVEYFEHSVYFPLLDDGLDAEEMMKGIPPRVARQQTQHR
ncbi:DUF2442 domain-containing protein [Aggregatilineales bacterium SYSU G02658]